MISNLNKGDEVYKLFESNEVIFDINMVDVGIMLIEVEMNDFRGKFSYCLEDEIIDKYLLLLKNLDLDDTGTLKMTDMDSDSYIVFNKLKYGHMIISGQLGCTFRKNYLMFEFEADQTIIANLIKRLEKHN